MAEGVNAGWAVPDADARPVRMPALPGARPAAARPASPAPDPPALPDPPAPDPDPAPHPDHVTVATNGSTLEGRSAGRIG